MRVFNIKARTLRLLLASMLLFTVSCTRQQFEDFIFCAALALNPFAFLFGGTNLIKTSDSADTFSDTNFQLTGPITDLALGPNNNVWGVTKPGKLFKCDNLGSNCVEVNLNLGLQLEFNRLRWFGNFGYIAATQGRIIRSADSGLNWSLINTGLNKTLRSVACDENNASICYTVGDNGTLGQSVDSGLNWDAQISGTGQQLNDVTTVEDGLTAWAVGNAYALTYTIDGQNWELHSNPNNLTNNLNRVHFKNSNDGIIVGNNIIETTNDGENFTQLSLGAGQLDNFKSMHFATDFGLIIGERGQGFSTNDFAQTLTAFDVPLF